jgi:hypothetical protein
MNKEGPGAALEAPAGKECRRQGGGCVGMLQGADVGGSGMEAKLLITQPPSMRVNPHT